MRDEIALSQICNITFKEREFEKVDKVLGKAGSVTMSERCEPKSCARPLIPLMHGFFFFFFQVSVAMMESFSKPFLGVERSTKTPLVSFVTKKVSPSRELCLLIFLPRLHSMTAQ